MAAGALKYGIGLFLAWLMLFPCLHSAEKHIESDMNENGCEESNWRSFHRNMYRPQSFRHRHGGIDAEDDDNASKRLDRKLMRAEANQRVIVVSQDGEGDFLSIGNAMDSIEINNKRRTIIRIKSGLYREKVVIPRLKPFVTLVADGDDKPIITWNDTASVPSFNGLPLGTFNSSTVAVDSPYFIARNILFQNTAPYPENGRDDGQAVALRISATKAAFYNCSFYGTQDTLYDHKGLHYFKDCLIQGSEDFIFGYGRSLYQNCHLKSVAKGAAAVTAQKRDNGSLSSGFSFVNCDISGGGSVYLGRAWGERSRVVFSYTYMSDVVVPQGWNDWGFPERQKTVYYGEYRCNGAGANTTARVQWARILSTEEAEPFLDTNFIRGEEWLLEQ